MLTIEQNDLVTLTGRNTAGGELMRRYWQPAALTEELPSDRPVKYIKLMGEDLVLFKDDQGRYGLVGRHCSHRGVDLCFGRLEDGGLRCPLHGWLFDIEGKCLEQPAEPPGSNFHTKINHLSYPCTERNGIVFAYLGPFEEGAEPPALPEFDCFVAPNEFTFAFKGLMECNWLQALEVGIDPAHASFLHRFFEDEDTADGYGKQFRAATADDAVAPTKILREHPCPNIEVEETDYGLRIFALRDLDEASTHVRITNMMFPNAIIIPMSHDMTITQWHVPIDDKTCYWYAIFSAFDEKVNKEAMRRQRLETYSLPDYRSKRNKSNNYGFDADEQRSQTYTGMGMDINIHDQWAVESIGARQDRTTEHLGASDKAIIANRRMLLQAIESVQLGKSPPMFQTNGMSAIVQNPIAIDTIAISASWQSDWQDNDLARRNKSAWAAKP